LYADITAGVLWIALIKIIDFILVKEKTYTWPNEIFMEAGLVRIAFDGTHRLRAPLLISSSKEYYADNALRHFDRRVYPGRRGRRSGADSR
jgi:hypothetical protein